MKQQLALIAALLLMPTLSLASNQWMMDNNAEQLIELNQRLLDNIQPDANGTIHIEALVFGGDQDTVYKLDMINDEATQASDISINIQTYPKVRIGHINFDDSASGQLHRSGKALADIDASLLKHNRKLKTILETHPNAKYYDLQGAPITAEEDGNTWGTPKFLIYW